jgi:hypothetical protein
MGSFGNWRSNRTPDDDETSDLYAWQLDALQLADRMPHKGSLQVKFAWHEARFDRAGGKPAQQNNRLAPCRTQRVNAGFGAFRFMGSAKPLVNPAVVFVPE